LGVLREHWNRKRVEVTGGWRKMYKEEIHDFLLTTKCSKIKYKCQDM
jgi:hypothetical protein